MMGARPKFSSAAYDWPEPARSELIAAERERIKRDKKRVKFCAVCGRKPEYPPQNERRHIYTLSCEKCQCKMVVHVNG